MTIDMGSEYKRKARPIPFFAGWDAHQK